jgi:large subunit ribosomal protein L18
MIKRYSTKLSARKTKTRAKLKRFSSRPRLSVFRSNKYIYAQIIDDQKGVTLVAVSEKELKSKSASRRTKLKSKTKIDKSFQLGEILAKKALKKKINQVYFDKGGRAYHGRVRALAEGARKAGLDF